MTGGRLDGFGHLFEVLTACMTAPLRLAQATRCGTSSSVCRGSVIHVRPFVYLSTGDSH
jgi:hypothetical protein